MPAVMQVLDVILAGYFNGFLSTVFPEIPGCFVGARPKTQCLDIAHGLQSVIEKGLDDFGRSAVAQSDIEKFYDSLPCLQVAQWLVAKGADEKHVACLLRHQMCPRVVLSVGTLEIAIDNRSIGGLTGSRTAGMFGRVPVESVMAERNHVWKQWGYKAGVDVLTVCSYVDNLFSAAASLHGAVSILEDFEEQLRSKWNLQIKPSSRCCMVAVGSPDQQTSPKWPLSNSFPVLGHVLQDSGSIRACWKRTRTLMWKAFWANPGSKHAHRLSPGQRLKLLGKAVVPQLDCRCTRWPPQRTIAGELDSMQRKMTATAMRISMHPGEGAPEYVRRRGRAAARHCKLAGNWSQRWFKRVVNWHDHLERPRNAHTWPAKTLHHNDREWLMRRRASLLSDSRSSDSCTAGRTNTRVFSGCVHMRWDDGVEFGRSQLV